MNFDTHPIRFVQHLIARYGGGIRLSFSNYFYRPNSIFDERISFWVDAHLVNDAWLISQLKALPEGWELAFNSIIKDERSRTHHIGLVDFAENAGHEAVRSGVYRLLGESALRGLSVYSSGRSYHGYINQLMLPKDWREFLGRLLLMNEISAAPVVDSRWVGHRLVGGYCALRWSMNTPWYRSMPNLVTKVESAQHLD